MRGTKSIHDEALYVKVRLSHSSVDALFNSGHALFPSPVYTYGYLWPLFLFVVVSIVGENRFIGS